MPRDADVLRDLVRAIDLAMEFAGDLSPEELEADLRTLSAVQHQLLILGEATKRCSDELRASLAQVPWSEMAGMRDRLIHRYDDVDAGVVWATVHEDLPDLLGALKARLAEIDRTA